MKRIGIYSGTFNPVHTGHIAFALQALEVAKLDTVYFLPERKPAEKIGVEHFGHRVAMVRQALKPHSRLEVLELDDVSFTVNKTLPKLESRFKDAGLVFLFGSDVIAGMATWPDIGRLFTAAELVIGMRSAQAVGDVKKTIACWQNAPETTLINSHAPDVSSSQIREALLNRAKGQSEAKGLLKSVAKYTNHHWLYVAVPE